MTPIDHLLSLVHFSITVKKQYERYISDYAFDGSLAPETFQHDFHLFLNCPITLLQYHYLHS